MKRMVAVIAVMMLSVMFGYGCKGAATGPISSTVPTAATKAITSGADNLFVTQKSDGGWQWENPDTITSSGVPTPNNTLGVTAQGLLDAYKISPDALKMNGCINTYDRLVSNSTNVTDPSVYKMRGPDITFLVELSEVTGNATYAAFARTRYQADLTAFGAGLGATGFAQYIRDIRKGQGLPALISWDINLYIQGVLALKRYYAGQGYDADAKAMAEVIYTSLYTLPKDFDLSNLDQASYWLSLTGAIEAFVTTGLHLAESAALVTTLKASQQSDGSFLDVIPPSSPSEDAQATAYAVMALLKAGERAAAQKGVEYLIINQLPNGEWTEDGGSVENTESTSEAIQAIYDFSK